MLGRTLSTAIALSAAAAAAAAGACAMSASASGGKGACRVVDVEKLPSEAGGGDALCSAVETAIAARAPGIRYTAEIRVLSKTALSAKLVAEGRQLPEQGFSVSDRNLNPQSIKRFADAIAGEIAKVAKS